MTGRATSGNPPASAKGRKSTGCRRSVRAVRGVVATANDLSALPPELLPKGRLDEIFFVDLPESDERERSSPSTCASAARSRPPFDLARLAAASAGFTGTELAQA